jgi:predicted phage tail protein
MKQHKNDVFDGKNRKDIFKFWAEEALMPQRNRLESEGTTVIDSLVGDGKEIKGAYKEVVEILSPHLKDEELRAFEDTIKKTEKLLRNANHSECVEYFDKKRDLMLGSAPTDVVTALASLAASGIAIGVADSKEDKISRTVSGALPVVAGLGVSTALTALLYSGGKGMALGAASSMILSGLGSAATRAMYPKNKQAMVAENDNKDKKAEVNKKA